MTHVFFSSLYGIISANPSLGHLNFLPCSNKESFEFKSDELMILRDDIAGIVNYWLYTKSKILFSPLPLLRLKPDDEKSLVEYWSLNPESIVVVVERVFVRAKISHFY